jgi:predicted lipoprotein with Yx(FWY)xxD motif
VRATITSMRPILLLLLVVALAVAGCGDDDETAAPAAEATTAETEQGDPAMEQDDAMEKDDAAMEKPGTRIVLDGSEFGDMLYDDARQAIYVFENDRERETTCYGECAEAWPPVYTKGAPRGGDGVDRDLLGTIERRDGRQQVTYAGRPLYYYAHEGPGEVRCHDVHLNGGLWWVVGADGVPLP